MLSGRVNRTSKVPRISESYTETLTLYQHMKLFCEDNMGKQAKLALLCASSLFVTA